MTRGFSWRAAAFCLITLGLFSAAARAQNDGTPAAAAPPPTIATAPPETREVIAEGRAVINLDRGGVPGAREAAIAQALRAAVEKTTGVFVSARTLTSNYQLVQDEVTMRADGFATLGAVLSERRTPGGELRVTVRALVSLRPLARRLKELHLVRAWRVRVQPAPGTNKIAPDAVALVEQTLVEAGFSVVSTNDLVSAAEAPDLVVRVSLAPRTVARMPLDTAAGPMTLSTLRVSAGLRAQRWGTRETVAALSLSETAAHIDENTARASAAGRALETLAPRLADALLVLPAQASRPVTLIVANLPNAARVGRLGDALRLLPGVRSVTRRAWQNKTAVWELDVTSEAVPLLARALEEDAAVRPFGLSVSGETRARIEAFAPAAARVSRTRAR